MEEELQVVHLVSLIIGIKVIVSIIQVIVSMIKVIVAMMKVIVAMILISFAQFMRDLREATVELLMQGLAMEEVRADGHLMIKMKDKMSMIFPISNVC